MSDYEDGDGGVVVGDVPATMVRKHIKKRALRNKALSVSFDEKNLRDFVTGFHKRKKKRRKEAQRQLQETKRLMRIEARKKRKQEREMALYGGNTSENPEHDELVGNAEEDGADLPVSVSETTTYETSNMTIKVTTSEISHDEDIGAMDQAPRQISNIQKNPNLLVKKKPLKRGSKRKPQKKGGKHASRQKDKKKSRVK